jgi:acetyltransferase-like isoleucine patch superfamily enzyme
MIDRNNVGIHATADVSDEALISEGTKIWHHVHVREGVEIGRDCILGKGVYVDFDVKIGSKCKIQNHALIYHGSSIEDGVFIGPHACLTNDRFPRAITPEGDLKNTDDWTAGLIDVKYGASIGAGAIILPGVTIGRFAMVGAGSVINRNVPEHGLVVGVPGRLIGYVCAYGHMMEAEGDSLYRCPSCGWTLEIKEQIS